MDRTLGNINKNTLTSDWYIDESSFPDCDDSELPPHFEGDGFLIFQGNNKDCYNNTLFIEKDVNEGVNFNTVFKRWNKLRKSITFIVNIDKSKSHELKEFIKSINGKIS